MESKSKRELNEFYGIHEPSSHDPPGTAKDIHQAKTRTLLPTTHNALVNMSSKDITNFGVTTTATTARESTPLVSETPRSPYQKLQSSRSEHMNMTRPHTSGTKFGKSTADAIPNGVPSDVHFVRVLQPSGPLIVPVRIIINLTFNDYYFDRK